MATLFCLKNQVCPSILSKSSATSVATSLLRIVLIKSHNRFDANQEILDTVMFVR
jgi:hypothetical protein